jgi:DNA invertase Pin-like site-specific DNA recombinase
MGRLKRHTERVYQPVGKPEQGAPAVGYVRYSADTQDPASIVTQKRRIQEYADNNGWPILRWYEEPESSAKYEELDERPVFTQLLADAGHEFHIVLCYANDRWARNMAVAYSTLSQLRRKRVWWATSDGRWDIDKVEQDGFDVAFAMDTQTNAAFVRRLSKRNIDAKEDRARDGYHNGSVPFGYLPPKYPKPPDGAPSTWRPPRMPVRRDPVNFPALVKIGELAAQGWSDSAVADELSGFTSTTPRFGTRPLSKDTIWAIRHMWFAREFAPGCGHGTIETPSGELIEGRHPSAWPYELWQKMVEVKAGQFHRSQAPVSRHTHEFSRIIICSACGRPLRIDSNKHVSYYRDTSRLRHLSCTAFGCLSVSSERVAQQFGSILRSAQLPDTWRETIARRCREITHDEAIDQVVALRGELEAEHKRLLIVFAKGYIAEDGLDIEVARIRAELGKLPPARTTQDAAEYLKEAIAAGEALSEMASCWDTATSEERRDIVWALLRQNGLAYDLRCQGIVSLMPRPAVLPVLDLGLGEHWELRGDGLWLRPEHVDSYFMRGEGDIDTLPYRAHRMSTVQRQEAMVLLESGLSPQQVAQRFGVSYWVIFRHMRRDMPDRTRQQQPKLTPEQEAEAREMLRQGQSLRQVAAHFNVSRMAIWRMTRRDVTKEASRQ